MQPNHQNQMHYLLMKLLYNQFIYCTSMVSIFLIKIPRVDDAMISNIFFLDVKSPKSVALPELQLLYNQYNLFKRWIPPPPKTPRPLPPR